MVKEFKYPSHGDVSNRKIFVIYETSKSLEGLDLAILGADEEKKVLEKLKEYKVTDGSKRDKIEGYDPAWSKAWRNFTKEKIIKDDEPKNEEQVVSI